MDIKIQQFINIFLAENGTNSFAYNVVLWFLPCLFVADSIYSKTIKDKKIEFIAIIALIAIYYVWIDSLPCLFWCTNLSVLAITFLSIGKHGYQLLCKTTQSKSKSIAKYLAILMVCIGLFYLGREIFHPQTNMLGNQIPPYYLFYGMAIIGTVIVFYFTQLVGILGRKSEKGINRITFFGRNSLIIMCIHEPLKRIVCVIFAYLSGTSTDLLRNNLYVSILISLVVMVSCIPFIIFINRYTPYLIGKHKTASSSYA